VAARFLESENYRILGMNFYSRHGEIDIIASDCGYLVFVEVKYRRDDRQGNPCEAVHYRKQQHLRSAAVAYMLKYYGRTDIPCRFDVVAILGDQITLYKNAFSLSMYQGY